MKRGTHKISVCLNHAWPDLVTWNRVSECTCVQERPQRSGSLGSIIFQPRASLQWTATETRKLQGSLQPERCHESASKKPEPIRRHTSRYGQDLSSPSVYLPPLLLGSPVSITQTRATISFNFGAKFEFLSNFTLLQ